MVVVDGRICRKEADSETVLWSGDVVINAVPCRVVIRRVYTGIHLRM